MRMPYPDRAPFIRNDLKDGDLAVQPPLRVALASQTPFQLSFRMFRR